MDAETNASTIDCAEHLGLMFEVRRVIYRNWKQSGVDLDDLTQTLYLFMHRCAGRYDPGRINPDTGEPFAWSTYFVAAAMRSQAGIVAEAMGIRRSRNQHGLRAHLRKASIEREVHGSDGLRMRDMIETIGEADDTADRGAVVRDIERVVAGMDPMWRQVYHRRFVLGERLVDVGRALGISRGRAQQVHHLILDEIRRASGGDAYPALRDWVAGAEQ